MSIQAHREAFAAAGGENTIRRVLPQVSAQILKDHKHPADVRRNIKFCNQHATELLDKASQEKRGFSDIEQNCFDALMALVGVSSIELKLNDLIDGPGGQPDKDRHIYAKGQKCAPDYRPSDLEGIGLGALLRGMVLGSQGNPAIQNVLSEGVDSAGGFSVPVHTMLEFADLIRSKSVLANAGAQTILLDTAKTSMATLVRDPMAGWRAENDPVNVDDIVLGHVQFIPKSLAVLVKVSRELLEDSLNIDAILLNSLAQGLAEQLDDAGLYGNGLGNSPTGLKSTLVTAGKHLALGANGAKLSAIGHYKALLTAMTQVANNDDQANAAIMAPRTRYDIAGMIDSSGQPLNPPKIIEDNLTLLDTSNVPVTIAQGTSNLASDIFVGNFSQMALGLRQGLRIEVLKESFAGNMQIGFLAHLRADWQVIRPSSFWLIEGVLAE